MIVKMTQLNMKDFNKPNEPFVVFGRMIPAFENGVWTYTEERFSKPYFKQYEDDEMDVSYVEEEGKAAFLYYVKNNCIGRIKIRSNWNGYALIEDIAVAKDYRKKALEQHYYIKRLSGQRRIAFVVLCLKHKILMSQLVVFMPNITL